ncbi:unnamed protein product [Acanthosepion pharaonis]|uniref:VWFA domain-containing protein n=1 Tax=Acanthosepion pharaonis TaxID=158019 RepID=A0A812ERL1_ACAPH|nr:unnamed protein product [Sepia pharaonis]
MLQFFHLNDSCDTRLAVIRQSGSSSVKINLQSGYSSRHFKIVLSSIKQSKEPAHNLTNGLLLMQEVFRADKRIGVPQIGIIFVVGKSQDATQVMQVAESLLSDEVILFAIGTKQTGKEFPAIFLIFFSFFFSFFLAFVFPFTSFFFLFYFLSIFISNFAFFLFSFFLSHFHF